MGSTIPGIARKLRIVTEKRSVASVRRWVSSETRSNSSSRRLKAIKRTSLFSKISPLGSDPNISVVPVLNEWASQCLQVDLNEFRAIIQTLRLWKRYSQALQVSEWLSTYDLCEFLAVDFAMQLDLIARVRGVESAESYFKSIYYVENNGMSRLYCTLLQCYVRECLVDKSQSLFQKMKDLGFTNTYAYNHILSLYNNTDQLDKIPDVMSEMTKEGFTPNYFSYRICIDAYGSRSDIHNMERILGEMKHIYTDWTHYTMAAHFYMKAGNREKALIFLKSCEAVVGEDEKGYNQLISHHANLGNKKEVMRLWRLQKANCKKLGNMEYTTVIGMLVKLEDLEEAQNIFEEWELSCKLYDFRVVNTLLIGYCQKGLTEKAESTLDEIIAKEKTPIPNSWSIVATGYMDEKNMEKAFECFKKALALHTELTKWNPEQSIIMAVFDWLVDYKDVEEVEAFMDLTKNVMRVNIEMYRALIRAYLRSGKEVDRILEMIKHDGIDMDEETEKIVKAQAV